MYTHSIDSKVDMNAFETQFLNTPSIHIIFVIYFTIFVVPLELHSINLSNIQLSILHLLDLKILSQFNHTGVIINQFMAHTSLIIITWTIQSKWVCQCAL